MSSTSTDAVVAVGAQVRRWRQAAATGDEGYEALLEMIRVGKLAPQKLIGRTIGLDEAPEALMAMDQFAGTGITVIARF